MEQEVNKLRLIRAYAGQYGLTIGIMWIVSFLCSMYSLDFPLLGHVGNFTALLSIFVEIRLMKKFQRDTTPLSPLYRWNMAMLIGMYASLLTTMGQYLYFQFLDNGHIVSSIEKIFNTPEYQSLLKQTNTPYTIEQMTEILASVNIGDMILSLILFNMLIALLFSIVCTWTSSIRATPQTTNNNQ